MRRPGAVPAAVPHHAFSPSPWLPQSTLASLASKGLGCLKPPASLSSGLRSFCSLPCRFPICFSQTTLILFSSWLSEPSFLFTLLTEQRTRHINPSQSATEGFGPLPSSSTDSTLRFAAWRDYKLQNPTANIFPNGLRHSFFVNHWSWDVFGHHHEADCSRHQLAGLSRCRAASRPRPSSFPQETR